VASSVREQGTVRKWLPERAFGFIRPDSGSDVFVHIRSLQGALLSLHIGQRVTFIRGEDRDGRPEAKHVWPADVE
jgi:cold shock protein